MKKIFIIGLLVAILLGLYGLFEFNRKAKPIEKQSAAYSLTSEDLYAAFSTNEESANEHYKGKVIEVNGKIEEINQNNGVMSIVLSSADYPLGGVTCNMASDYPKLAEGDLVQLKGECQGMLMHVILNQTILL